MKILIVEDEKKTAAYLCKGLGENGFVVDVASEGEEGLHLACTGAYDLLILDVMLPTRDGWSIITELRRVGKQMPVLFLTARDAVPDRVKGLELGADDYLVKPFAFSELLARAIDPPPWRHTTARHAPHRRFSDGSGQPFHWRLALKKEYESLLGLIGEVIVLEMYEEVLWQEMERIQSKIMILIGLLCAIEILSPSLYIGKLRRKEGGRTHFPP